MPDIKVSAAYGVNNNGSIIVGTVDNDHSSIYWMDGSPPTTRNMGFLEGGTRAQVFALNSGGDGKVAVGFGNTTGGVWRAFRWKKNRIPEMENLGAPAGSGDSEATDLNNAADIIVGYSGASAIRWTDTGGDLKIEELRAPQEASSCSASGTNDDGTIIVGHCKLSGEFSQYSHAVCWLGGKTTEVTVLECLGNWSSAWATAVSDDGNVIVGYSTEPGNLKIRHAVRWKRNPGTKTFRISNLNVYSEPPQDDWHAIAYGVSQDGTVIVGGRTSLKEHSSTIEAFIWKEDATPKVQKLADITEGYKHSIAYDVIKKADGTSIAVGSSAFRDGSQAAVRWNNLSIENLNFP